MKKILALLMVFVMMFTVMSVSAFAAESPTAEQYYDVKLSDYAASLGICTVSPSQVKAGELVTATVADAEKNGFVSWSIDGEYVIVSGDLQSDVLVFEAYSDIIVDAEVTNAPTGTPTTAAPNTSPTSPQTGPLGTNSVAVFVVLFAGVAVLFAILYRAKRRA